MTNNVKGRPVGETERPTESEDTFNGSDYITSDQAFVAFDFDALFDEITGILNARTARLEGALAMIGAHDG